jgi:hypothetical protein
VIRGHPVAVVQLGDGPARVLDYDSTHLPVPTDAPLDEWADVGDGEHWRVREAGVVPLDA